MAVSRDYSQGLGENCGVDHKQGKRIHLAWAIVRALPCLLIHHTRNPTSNKAMMLKILIMGLIAGPAVSL